MSVRGYVFVRLKNDVTPQQCLGIRRKLEDMLEVISVDDLIDIDWCDMLALADAPILVSATVNLLN